MTVREVKVIRKGWQMNTLRMLVILLIPVSYVYAQSNQTDSVTITTYYPSPYGSYNQLNVYRSVKFRPVNKDNLPKFSPQEGELVYNKTDEKLYIYNGTKWKPVGSSFDDSIGLIGAEHTVGDCLAEGGEVVPSDTGFKLCKFTGDACKSGWKWYKGFSETRCNYCSTTLACGTCAHSSTCHSFSDNPAIEVFKSDDQCCCMLPPQCATSNPSDPKNLVCGSAASFGCPGRTSCTATATRIAIGCY